MQRITLAAWRMGREVRHKDVRVMLPRKSMYFLEQNPVNAVNDPLNVGQGRGCGLSGSGLRCRKQDRHQNCMYRQKR